jgi:hypothetical protein
LAGALGLTDKTGAPFRCRDANVKHRALNTVPYSTVITLTKDSTFMSDKIQTGLRDRLLAELPKKKSLFK